MAKDDLEKPNNYFSKVSLVVYKRLFNWISANTL